MLLKNGKRGTAVSVPYGLGLSLTVNLLITIIGSVGIAVMIHQNKIPWENTGYWILLMLLLASFFGAKTAITAIKTQVYLIALMSGVLYWVILLCITALFFGGNYSSVPETAALIGAGSMTAALLRRSKKRLPGRKRRSGYR